MCFIACEPENIEGLDIIASADWKDMNGMPRHSAYVLDEPNKAVFIVYDHEKTSQRCADLGAFKAFLEYMHATKAANKMQKVALNTIQARGI